MSSISPRSYKVALLLFEGADILDFTGPIEIFSHVSHTNSPDNLERVFEITTIAKTTPIRAASSLTLKPDLLLPEALPQITDFDILLIPGAPPTTIQALLEPNAPELSLIHRYTTTDPSNQPTPHTRPRPRMLFSVCTGAFLLAATGKLSGLTVTTHHHALNTLRDLCTRVNGTGPATRVVCRRFVDGGCVTGTDVQVITAGGISSGLDATFYIICRLINAETAATVSRVMEYGWSEPDDRAWPVRFRAS